ncbi:preprotein translocase subunit SecY [candidate division KSB3 bacterium]|uniref:Protein translocase subunit SecY n=1 Tax=candidate division KSB3 bacterium TaxID=2044937 RepID=A0A9D5JVL8_9BACT|nr:preprotein translocase subunit SecY [candidate division KSB3 bacterium]
MLQVFRNIFKIPELKRRVLITLGLLAVYRFGTHIPTPGVDAQVLTEIFESAQGTVLGMVDLFTGGALKRLTVFALGIMPYISASIILQLLTVVVPYLERLAKEGEQGRKKITQYTRYGTVVLSAVQALGISIGLESMQGPAGAPVVPVTGWAFRLTTMITLTAGTAFIMWLGEQITERGIGNGISLIIFAGIVTRLPAAVANTIESVRRGDFALFSVIGLLIMMALVVAAVIIMQQGTRKIPVQYAKRVVGRRIYGGQSTHIPLRVNTAGVIPVIFASSIIVFPATVARFIDNEWMRIIAENLSPGHMLYTVLYATMIIFFAYFYTAIVFNPTDLAENMKKYGGYIPGVRPGKRTATYIDSVLTRITLAGAIFLALIAILPQFLTQSLNVPFYFGGTALLIVVGVALDTMQQIESHLLTRHYEGFMKKGKLRGRR